MICFHRRLASAFGTLVLGLVVSHHARAAAACEVYTERAPQADGSALIVSTRQCSGTSGRHITVSLKPTKGAIRDLQRFRQSGGQAPTGGATLKDIDRDGFSEVQLTGACGSGAVCTQSLYKLTASRYGLFLLYTGAYANVEVLDGFLIESGKAGCCTWNVNAYKLPDKDRSITASDLRYRIQVGVLDAQPPSTQLDEEADCRFTAKADNKWVTVAPPSKALEKICEIYGPDYVLDKAQ